jgi:hypothetical protein
VVAAALALPGAALAQEEAVSGFDGHGFRAAAVDADARDPLVVQRPGAFEGGAWFVGGLVEYADSPVRVVTLDADGVSQYSNRLDNLMALNASGGVAVNERLRLDLSAPLYFASTGVDGGSQGAGLGDVRAAAMVSVLSPGEDGGVGFGVVPFLDLPLGDPEAYLGSGGLGGGAKFALTAELSQLTVTADVGFSAAPDRIIDTTVQANGESIPAGAAVGWLVSPDFGLTAEARFDLPAMDPTNLDGTGIPGEVYLSGRKLTEGGGTSWRGCRRR